MSRAKRRRARQGKNRRAGTRRSRAGERAVSSAGAAVGQAYERFARYIRSASSFEDAASAARADLRAAAGEVARLACGLDLITVVSSVRVSMIMNHAVTGEEPPAAILELIALVMACQDSSASDIAEVAAESEFMPPQIEAVAREVLAVGSMVALFDSPPADADSAVVFFSVQREINMRNPVYPHMLLDTLRGLLGDPAVNDDCRATLGFTGLEAVNVMNAVRALASGIQLI